MQPTSAEPDKGRPVAVIGGGSIGTAFAIVFARAGYTVKVQDPDIARHDVAVEVLRSRLAELERYGLIDEPVDVIVARVTIGPDIKATLASAQYVQECAPENLELKKALFAKLDALAEPDAVIASSTSAIRASHSAAHVKGRSRFLVCHPANPPFLIPVIEVVPAPFTDPAVADRARLFLLSCHLQPIIVKKEMEGFAFNRLQGAVLREAYCLVRDGVVTADEIDQMVRDGLGLRWSFMGPFETVDLNTRGGIASHALKMGPAYERMGNERGQHDPWTPDLVARVAAERREMMPLEEWEEKNAWRDRRLMALLKHRREQEELESKK